MATRKFSVTRISTFLPGKETVIEPCLAWPKAWRLARKLNNEAREAFKTGRTMYDVPEYQVRQVSDGTSE